MMHSPGIISDTVNFDVKKEPQTVAIYKKSLGNIKHNDALLTKNILQFLTIYVMQE